MTDFEKTKQKMKDYRDLFGQPLLNYNDIDNATNNSVLIDIINQHAEHIEMMCNDAQSSVSKFLTKTFY